MKISLQCIKYSTPTCLVTSLGCCYITVDFATAVSQKLVLGSFPEPILFRKGPKTLDFFYYFHHLSQSSRETRSLNGIFVKLCKHSYVMLPLQNRPLCSSTAAPSMGCPQISIAATPHNDALQDVISHNPVLRSDILRRTKYL